MSMASDARWDWVVTAGDTASLSFQLRGPDGAAEAVPPDMRLTLDIEWIGGALPPFTSDPGGMIEVMPQSGATAGWVRATVPTAALAAVPPGEPTFYRFRAAQGAAVQTLFGGAFMISRRMPSDGL